MISQMALNSKVYGVMTINIVIISYQPCTIFYGIG